MAKTTKAIEFNMSLLLNADLCRRELYVSLSLSHSLITIVIWQKQKKQEMGVVGEEEDSLTENVQLKQVLV